MALICSVSMIKNKKSDNIMYCLIFNRTNSAMKLQTIRNTLLACSALALWATSWAAPDEEVLGKSSAYPKGTMQEALSEKYKVGSYSAFDTIFPSRSVSHGSASAWPLEPGNPLPTITYIFEGKSYTLEDYLQRRRITSLLVVQGGKILFERYQYDRQPDQKFISFSMSKSITAILVDQALERGLIKSLDDTVETYAPEFKDSPYAKVTIKNLLQMGSGVAWEENYGGRDDVSDLWGAYFRIFRGGNPTQVMTRSRARESEQGTRFKYSTGDTTILCHVLHGATKKNIAEITQEWLWIPLGAQAPASWIYGWHGIEYCGGGFNATARDYARLGMLLARDGVRDGNAIIPKDFLIRATDSRLQPKGFGFNEAGTGFGYGFQFWLGNAATERTFALMGVYGQYILVNPPLDAVVVHTAVWPRASDREASAERRAVVTAIMQALRPK